MQYGFKVFSFFLFLCIALLTSQINNTELHVKYLLYNKYYLIQLCHFFQLNSL